MLIIGIDPGITGSICFFENGKIIDLIDMPNMADGKKQKRQVNGAQIYNEIFLGPHLWSDKPSKRWEQFLQIASNTADEYKNKFELD